MNETYDHDSENLLIYNAIYHLYIINVNASKMKCLYLKPLLDFHNGCNNPSNNANYRLFGLGELYNVKAPYNKVNNRKQLDVLGFSGLRHLNKVLNSPCTVIRQVLCLTTIKP